MRKKMSSLDKLMEKLLKEVPKKKKKKKSTSARRKVVGKTKVDLMRKRHDKEGERIIQSGLERHHIRAAIEHRHCGFCKDITTIVRSMLVISKTKAGDERITVNVLGTGMYEFHSDLPIVSCDYDTFVPVCPDCLTRHIEEKAKVNT